MGVGEEVERRKDDMGSRSRRRGKQGRGILVTPCERVYSTTTNRSTFLAVVLRTRHHEGHYLIRSTFPTF